MVFKKFLCVFIVFSSVVFSVGYTKQHAMLQVLYRSLMEYHVQPHLLDDAYSEKVFDYFINRLDPDKRFFLKSDVDSTTPSLGLKLKVKAGAFGLASSLLFQAET